MNDYVSILYCRSEEPDISTAVVEDIYSNFCKDVIETRILRQNTCYMFADLLATLNRRIADNPATDKTDEL